MTLATRRSHQLANVFPAISFGNRDDFAPVKTLEAVTQELTASIEPTRRRTQIWELHSSFHCSIIGTCMSSAELRRLLVRLDVAGAEAADDHDLHMLGVLLAARPKAGAKMLQKALDRRHQLAINQFAKARHADALRTLWAEARKRGEIPGAYWALLTHPAATDALMRHAFGDVHMLSHLVGSANRADIRRLCELEAENVALTEKIERQQRQLRDGFAGRDATIRRLNDLLAKNIACERETSSPPGARADDDEHVALQDAIADLDKRLGSEIARRERLERRLETATTALHDAERRCGRLERERDELRRELAAVEPRLGLLAQQSSCDAGHHLDVLGRTVLYVGGRANQIPQCRAVVERAGGAFLHHDAGLEHNAALLPGFVGRADIVVFPVDCVSHEAVATIKRSCGQLGKRYIPLRTSSLTCLVSTLATMQGVDEIAISSAI